MESIQKCAETKREGADRNESDAGVRMDSPQRKDGDGLRIPATKEKKKKRQSGREYITRIMKKTETY